MAASESGQALGVSELRGELVITAADVAVAFGVETREVVQAIKRNPKKLTDRHAFEITEDELDLLEITRRDLKLRSRR